MSEHELKTWPCYFELLSNGTKRFEIREDDRRFGVGDLLLLREWDRETELYSGREMKARVTYLTTFMQQPGYVVMGIQPVAEGGDTDAE